MFEDKINLGIAFLNTQKQKDGSFLGLSSKSAKDFKNALVLHPTFPTSLILTSISSLELSSQIKELKQDMSSFLLSQKSGHWSFNYWAKGSKEMKELPYPDDLDDTFCALSALSQHNPNLIDGTVLASIVTLLTSLELTEGGPYRTWLVTEDAPEIWRDIDIAVNSNIAYFLSLINIDIPNLTDFIEKSIANKNFSSPYYHSEYPILYFISRFYKGKNNGRIKELLLSKKEEGNGWGNPLHSALAISALMNLGVKPNTLDGDIEYLIKNQAKDGSWKPYAFYIDPTRNGQRYYAGSPSLTTAFCLEAITLYAKKLHANVTRDAKRKDTRKSTKLQRQILNGARRVFTFSSADLEIRADKILKKILKNDTNKQITLLPYYVKRSLNDKARDVSDDFLIKLGTASLLGWVAYSIFDDFLDSEGDPVILPVATVAHRHCTAILERILPKETGFNAFFHDVIDGIDEANLWEVSNCRSKLSLPDFGSYEQLARRSLGHAIAPLAVLFYLGYKRDSKEIKAFLTFFEHYIIAKQLLDDAHDFEEDFEKERVTPVVAMLLRKKKVSEEALGEIFWHEIIDNVCSDIFKHTKHARKALLKISHLLDTSIFENIVLSVENSAQKALTEKENALKFIKSYQK